jgi:hypothetical protein
MTPRASVTSDKSTRTIELSLEGMPTLNVTESWHTAPRLILPDKARLTITDGEPRSIVVFGAVIKKSGQPSEHVRADRTYRPTAYRETERLDLAPGWVKELFTQAPIGISSFTWVSREEAQVL